LILAIGGLIGFGLMAYLASKLLPLILQKVRWEKDLFLIYSVSTGLVLASLGTVLFGIPMALAGFVAGLAINQSKDTEEVRKAILPFRDLFAVLFFVVIGSLIQPSQLANSWRFAALVIILMILLKTLPTALFARVGKLKVKPLQFATGISQIGEFSFVLGSIAFSEKALSVSQYTGVLVAVVISIVFSTLLVRKIGIRPGV
jgi:CPA2 family monovalent cation:H+ antiporter-2